MKLKFMACFLAMALFLSVVPNTASAERYYVTPGYTYYNLPQGYHYEYWNQGPVIINSLTGELMSLAILQNMFPWHPWSVLHYPPHYVRDWRNPYHRRGWDRRPHYRPHHRDYVPHRAYHHREHRRPPRHHGERRHHHHR